MTKLTLGVAAVTLILGSAGFAMAQNTATPQTAPGATSGYQQNAAPSQTSQAPGQQTQDPHSVSPCATGPNASGASKNPCDTHQDQQEAPAKH